MEQPPSGATPAGYRPLPDAASDYSRTETAVADLTHTVTQVHNHPHWCHPGHCSLDYDDLRQTTHGAEPVELDYQWLRGVIGFYTSGIERTVALDLESRTRTIECSRCGHEELARLVADLADVEVADLIRILADRLALGGAA
jgi:hypothetical protein